MEDTTKVSKTVTAKYDILSDVIASPTRIKIVGELADSPTGLRYQEIAKVFSEGLGEMNVQRHFNHLLQKKVIEDEGDGKYGLSKLGKETYNSLVNVATRAKSEKIFSEV
jgi:DNA-binding transcriptional ArsR family regulator